MLEPDRIFSLRTEEEFRRLALEIFHFQAVNCPPYRDYLSLLGILPEEVRTLEKIPFLPIELFKTHRVYSASTEPEIVFTSSSTTGQIPARHYVAELSVYERAFTEGFTCFYGDPSDTAVFALLPNYLERSGSSLVYMADRLITHGGGGFYLHDHLKLIRDLKNHKGKKILLGVSYALLDLAESYPMPMENTIIMETGGMKGQRVELPKDQLHTILQQVFRVPTIHSEYGMAELMSQAYSTGGGIFETPPWMSVSTRDINDPFRILGENETGGLNLIDLANVYSCSFIQTQDMGRRMADGRFLVTGRITGSDIRGCNLLVDA